MSKINRIRLINISYNHDAIRISDELLSLNGESTLISLQNGGGKSVLVQLLSAPFVHTKYRNAKTRKFSDYFRTSQPSFILVEWELDAHAGYLLTGMMVRKNPKLDEPGTDQLDIMNFLCAYQEDCEQDIQHLPVVERDGKAVRVKNWLQCRFLFDQYRRNPDTGFYTFDMNNSSQRKDYFQRLAQYRINYREWENIIHKVNEQEAGLGELFKDCRQEKDLVDKWFLDEIEKKLGRSASDDGTEGGRIRGFQDLMEKYIRQCRQQDAKIRRKERVEAFQQDSAVLREHAEGWNQAEEDRKVSLSRILGFLRAMEHGQEEAEDAARKEADAMEELDEELQHLHYEELSERWYEKHKVWQSRKEAKAKTQEALSLAQAEQEACTNRQHQLELASALADVNAQQDTVTQILQKIEVARGEEKELLPEHDYLGGILARHYEALRDQRQEDLVSCTKDRAQKETRQKEVKGLLSKNRAAGEDAIRRISRLEAEISGYDAEEARYNRRYQAGLVRNLLRCYPEGTMEAEDSAISQKIRENAGKKADALREQSTLAGKIRAAEDAVNAAVSDLYDNETAREKAAAKVRDFEEQISLRRDILKYAGLPETSLYDREGILTALQEKRAILEDAVRTLTLSVSSIDNELDSLTSGRTVKLSDALTQEFARADLPVVYGLQWLQKNGRSAEENEALVKAHPFLPYALILSKAELALLSRDERKIYTDTPIPIVTRELLTGEDAEKEASDGTLVEAGDAHFYLYFNHALLDEKKRAEMLSQLRAKREDTLERLAQKREASDATFRRMETIRSQTLTQDGYKGAKKDLADLEEQALSLQERKTKAQENLSGLRTREAELSALLLSLDAEKKSLEERAQDFAALKKAYEVMLARLREKEEKEEEKKALDREQTSLLQEEKDLDAAIRQKIGEAAVLSGAVKEAQEHLAAFASFSARPLPEKPETLTIDPADIAAAEGRYHAIEEKTGGRLRSLEDDEARAQKALDRLRRKLDAGMKRYQMEKSAFEEVEPSEEAMDRVHEKLGELDRRIRALTGEYNERSAAAAVAENEKDAVLRQIRETCGREEPLAESELQKKDYPAERARLTAEKQQHDRAKRQFEARVQLCQSMRDRLDACRAEAESLGTAADLAEDFSRMSEDELRSYTRTLQEAFTGSENRKKDERQLFAGNLLRLLGEKKYEEDFFQRPLQSLSSMVDAGDAPAEVYQHLCAILDSIDRTMQKLEVDLAFVRRDREQLTGQLFDYVKSVHAELGKIDGNSTIRIGGRSVKMLRIELPDFDAGESTYRQHLDTMFDALVTDGLAALSPDQKETALHDLVGRRLTTRELYNEVVGTASVHIHLHKIEANREVPITWTDVTRNSGGEGFVSAFVILSSLLYYMRRDESDLFADDNEGKVLLMDNPFGVVSSAHLLIPMMSLAKKNNTQLICLSALSGGEIYDRFSNIYVLNLVQASLARGTQYLRSDHRTGADAQALTPSRVWVRDSASDEADDKLLF